MKSLTNKQIQEAILSYLYMARGNVTIKACHIAKSQATEILTELYDSPDEPKKETHYVEEVVTAEQVSSMYSLFNTAGIKIGYFDKLHIYVDALYEDRKDLEQTLVKKNEEIRVHANRIESLERERDSIKKAFLANLKTLKAIEEEKAISDSLVDTRHEITLVLKSANDNIAGSKKTF